MRYGAEEAAQLAAISAAQFRAILETAPDAFVVIDSAGTICAFSAAAEEMFGYSAAEAIGRNVALLMPEPDAYRHDSFIARYLQTGERKIIGQGRRVYAKHKNGTVFAVRLSIGETDAGGRRLFTAFMHDLATEDTAERRLQEVQAEMHRQSRVGIAATMSTALAHEINQPLSAISNYVEAATAMLEPSLPFWDRDEIFEALRGAAQEAVRAGEIVSRLRRFVSRGELQRTLAMPEELATQACALATIDAKAHGLQCHVDVGSDSPPVLVDPIQIQQVLLNLARNAIEAMEEGDDETTIVFSVRSELDSVCFAVLDNGPGVPAGHNLFEPFKSTKHDGMGLGLSICKTIVEAHGGRIWHEDREGTGSAFKFTIPMAQPPDEHV